MPDLAADLPILRQRFCELTHTAQPVDKPDQPLSPRELLDSQLADGAWDDIDYANDALGPWDAARHLDRLLRLASAWYRREGDTDALLDGILRGLRAWYARDLRNPNWWHNQIGTPMRLGDILLCIQPACPPELIEAAVPSFQAHHPVLRFTGQNMIWVAAIQVRHGILTGDTALVSQGYILAGRELRIVAPEEEGLQADMSFYQHGTLLYSGGYGQGYACDLARLMTVSAGTHYAMPEHKVELLIRMVLDGSRWMVRGRTFDYSAVGREISRAGHSARGLVHAATLLAALDHPRSDELAELAAADGGSYVQGNRCFWRSDYMLHHRPDYAISLRMHSSRVWNADMACCGGEGRVCHHMAEGAGFLYTDGDDYRDIFPVWEWHQIPGITAEQGTELKEESLRFFGPSELVGGASDGSVGCMGAIVEHGPLRARKAWCLFDDTLVALGAGISCDTDNPVRTTLDQRHWRGQVTRNGEPIAAGTYPLQSGDTFAQGPIAWHLLDGTGELRLGEQSGAWSDCGVGSSKPLSLPVLNAGIDHGTGPRDATYAYAIGTGTGTAPPPIAIIANTGDLQAVWHRQAQRGQLVAYAAGAIDFPDGQRIAFDAPCFLLYQPRERATDLVLAQPASSHDRLRLTLSGRLEASLDLPLPTQEYRGASIRTSIQLP